MAPGARNPQAYFFLAGFLAAVFFFAAAFLAGFLAAAIFNHPFLSKE